MPDQLFCYGTLCVPEIMRRVVGGRVAEPVACSIMGYACYSLSGLEYPGIVPEKGERVTGVLYSGLSRAQLAKLDAYEGEQYRRQRVLIDVGQALAVQAWTYILQPRYYHRRSEKGWSLEQFRRRHLAQYLRHRDNKMHGLHGRDTN